MWIFSHILYTALASSTIQKIAILTIYCCGCSRSRSSRCRSSRLTVTILCTVQTWVTDKRGKKYSVIVSWPQDVQHFLITIESIICVPWSIVCKLPLVVLTFTAFWAILAGFTKIIWFVIPRFTNADSVLCWCAGGILYFISCKTMIVRGLQYIEI